jgi:hypothetical protein
MVSLDASMLSRTVTSGVPSGCPVDTTGSTFILETPEGLHLVVVSVGTNLIGFAHILSATDDILQSFLSNLHQESASDSQSLTLSKASAMLSFKFVY